jgi:hypothetical protein
MPQCTTTQNNNKKSFSGFHHRIFIPAYNILWLHCGISTHTYVVLWPNSPLLLLFLLSSPIHIWKCHKETHCVAILNKQKHYFFSFTKLESRREEQVLPGGADTSVRWEEVGKGCRGVTIAQILCTHVSKWKMIPVEIVSWMGEGVDKAEQWRRWIQVWHIWYIVRTFVNTTMYHHPEQ